MLSRLASRRAALIVWGAVVLLLAFVGVLWIVQQGEVLPNTRIGGVDLGGMTPQQAREAIAEEADERESTPIVVSVPEEAVVGDPPAPHRLEPSAIQFEVDRDETLDRALAVGREGWISAVRDRVRSLFGGARLSAVERFDQAALEAWVSATTDAIDRSASLGDVEVMPETLEVTVIPPAGEVSVDREALGTRVRAALGGHGPPEVEAPAEVGEPPAETADVEAVADEVREILDAPLELVADDAAMTLEPTRLAQVLAVEAEEESQSLQIVVPAERVEQHLLEDAAAAFDRAPVDATYVVPKAPPTRLDAQRNASFEPVAVDATIEGGRRGRAVDAETLAEQLTGMVRELEREAQVELEEVEPEVPIERQEEMAPTHLIGTFTTYHQAGQTRVRNIQRLADVVDDTSVRPGEQFSINEISGRRSCDKGYFPAGTIVNGELVDTCGGGTSQFGTTTFNAAFFSGLPLDQWKAHSWYISRYPIGREATLSYPQLDVKFTNSTDGVLVVRTSYTSTSITVSIYGQPVADRVSATHSDRRNWRSHDTERRPTDELYESQERVVQSGSDGFSVSVTRTIARDGGTDTETINTVYQPQTRIVEYGTRESPEADEPETSDDDAADDTDDGGSDEGGSNDGGSNDGGSDDGGSDDGGDAGSDDEA